MKTLEEVIKDNSGYVKVSVENEDGTDSQISLYYAGFVAYLLQLNKECYYSDNNIFVKDCKNRYVQ